MCLVLCSIFLAKQTSSKSVVDPKIKSKWYYIENDRFWNVKILPWFSMYKQWHREYYGDVSNDCVHSTSNIATGKVCGIIPL